MKKIIFTSLSIAAIVGSHLMAIEPAAALNNQVNRLNARIEAVRADNLLKKGLD
jgi:hypothetical protein